MESLALTLVLFVSLAALAVIDARTMRLPDWLTLPLIAAGLVMAWLTQASLISHAAGALIGYGGLVALEIAYRRLRGRDGIGRGDAKLLAAGGAWCGVWALPLILLAASVSALTVVLVSSLIMRRGPDPSARLAFGPYLALAIALVWAASQAGLTPVLS
ncbi:A24 family peptidase [Hyphomonadaceae bacterium BL14]|nr:A24 family peptidase [Hyphomonadaceae bacterium BL14]